MVIFMIETKREGEILHIKVPNHWEGLKIEELLTKIWVLPKKMVHDVRMPFILNHY